MDCLSTIAPHAECDVDGVGYQQTPKGNVDVTGRYFVWTTNLGGDRPDAVRVKIPAERFVGR